MAAEGGENICVSVRVRPLNDKEQSSRESVAWRVVEGTSILPNENNPRRNAENQFAFGEWSILFAFDSDNQFLSAHSFPLTLMLVCADHVFDSDGSTQEVYDKCARNIINSALEGRNGTQICSRLKIFEEYNFWRV